jgi:hypothetical protein
MNATTQIVFKRTINFPTICKGIGQGKGFKTIKVEIQLATQICKDWETLEEKRMYVFTASASTKGMYGQCLNYIHNKAEQYIVPEAMQNVFKRIYEIWDEYHLNELQSGTKRQTAALSDGLHRADHYTEACEYLDSIGLLVDNGFEYGHGWLCKEIPDEIVNEIMTWQTIEEPSDMEIERLRRKAYRQ